MGTEKTTPGSSLPRVARQVLRYTNFSNADSSADVALNGYRDVIAMSFHDEINRYFYELLVRVSLGFYVTEIGMIAVT